MLRFQDVSFTAGQNLILQDINFTVSPGEVVAVLGESGAGKSTLFKLLIAEKRPTKGTIEVDDFSLESLSFNSIQSYRRQIGIVFQDFRLLPNKTVFQNVAFALEVCGEEAHIKKKVIPLLKLVGLDKKAKQFPRELSGGEKQRVAIARALVHDPKILIADEATGNLDPKSSREISLLLKKINEEKNITILFSTHDPVMVLELFPRVIRLEEGKILFDEVSCNYEKAFSGII